MAEKLKTLVPIVILAIVLWSIVNVVRQPGTQGVSLWTKTLQLIGLATSQEKETPRSFEYVPGKLNQQPASPAKRGEPDTSYQSPASPAGGPTLLASPSPAAFKPPAPPPLPKLPPPGSSLGVNAKKPPPPPLPLKTSAPKTATSVLGTLENFFDSVVESIIGK